MTGDVHQGEDLAQEAFSRLFAGRSRYRSDARFSTYLWRIALNVCRDEHRRDSRRREISLEATSAVREDGRERLSAGGDEPSAVVSRSEEARMIVEALDTLPDGFRAVVVLRHYEGLRFREIAEALGIPEGTVKSRMAESLKRLARAFGHESTGEGQPAAVEPSAGRKEKT
jgi:RNA polymerase sigma-70 factor (ECF subfamily)